MTDALIAISRYMSADLEQLRTVSQNVANTQTPGYRAMTLAPMFVPTDSTADNKSAPGVMQMRNFVSVNQGAVITTGRSLDFALSGNAYFCVQTPNGVRYTRNGNLHLDRTGALVTAGGNHVLGGNGLITLSDNSVNVDAQGRISLNGKPLGQFAIVALPENARLESDGNGLYSMVDSRQTGNGGASVHAAPAVDFRLRQGALEAANTETSGEAVKLIQISRHMESLQRAMLTYDQIMNSAINNLGNK